MKECPKCGAEMERQPGEPDVNIPDGWVCTNDDCAHFEPYESEEPI